MDSNGVLLLDMEDRFYYSWIDWRSDLDNIETSLGDAFDDILDCARNALRRSSNQLAERPRLDCNGWGLRVIETCRKT